MKLKKQLHRRVDGYSIYIDEFATVWRVSAKRKGYAMPCAVGWSYKKKDYPTVDALVMQFMREVGAYRISALSCVSKRTVLPKKK